MLGRYTPAGIECANMTRMHAMRTAAGTLEPEHLAIVYTPPTAADTRRFLREIERVADALSRPPDQAAAVIANYQAEGDIHRFYRESMPSLTKVNENRREVKVARDRLLAVLSK